MRRADIARSPLFLVAQTMSSPCPIKGEGSACYSGHRFNSRGVRRPLSEGRIDRSSSRYGVTHWQLLLIVPSVRTSHGIAFLHVPGRACAWREGFAVISRCFEQRFRCSHPKLRCQTVPSIWTLGNDQPVIPRVPFSR
jgi:hypothetical protein